MIGNNSSDNIIYEDQDIKVTPELIIHSGKALFVSDISSISTKVERWPIGFVLFAAIFGMFFCLILGVVAFESILLTCVTTPLGVFLFALAAFFAITKTTKYSIQINHSQGEKYKITLEDKERAQEFYTAINCAIAGELTELSQSEESEENLLFRESDKIVTPTRVVLKHKTYAVSWIKRVDLQPWKPNYIQAILLCFLASEVTFGLYILVFSRYGYYLLGLMVVLWFIVIGFYVYRYVYLKCVVFKSSGETVEVTFLDQESCRRFFDAISNAKI